MFKMYVIFIFKLLWSKTRTYVQSYNLTRKFAIINCNSYFSKNDLPKSKYNIYNEESSHSFISIAPFEQFFKAFISIDEQGLWIFPELVPKSFKYSGGRGLRL